ncbi:unnamed protein product [Hermetia illucens]|uniref:Uncharacterized protein n=1 Tax=Hermetia illucens TaxID=343691 RepID=A0A7R8V1P8_HERIL|nr:dentin sialophosphoprotein isoform X2 [Hermetia illucens]CAD7091103.1 unnamed protein product [Hermetia illucens]
MNTHIVILACLCGALAYALPVSNSDQPQENIDLVQIPLNGDKELDILTLGESGQLTERNKRTIGILRQLFPELSKQVEQSVNKVIGQLIRAIGPSLLRTAVQGNSRSRSRTSFDSDFTDDDDGETSNPSGTKVEIDLPNFDDDDDATKTSEDNSVSGGSQDGTSSTTEPGYVYMKKVDESNSDSDILSVSLNTDLITRTDSATDGNSDDADTKNGGEEDSGNNDNGNDGTTDSADEENKDDSNNEDSSNSNNDDTTPDTQEEKGGDESSSDSANDAEDTTKSEDSNII